MVFRFGAIQVSGVVQVSELVQINIWHFRSNYVDTSSILEEWNGGMLAC